MRKRLTIEGDGGSDDKRIMSLVKTFIRWSQSNSLSDEEMETTYQKMLFTLGKGFSWVQSVLCVWLVGWLYEM